MPPRYTNCEIHASLMNGILGVNIPFSDHNQSPRNCYQCLNEYELVLLSNGNYKMIKDIIIGDEVICFNPITNITNKSLVVNRYHRQTSKIVYTIETISGREITATYDHKFMTFEKGWLEVYKFNSNIKLGINLMPNYISNENKETIIIIDNDNVINIELLTLLNLILPLTNDYYYMSIISRLAGYYTLHTTFDGINEIDIAPLVPSTYATLEYDYVELNN
jgi:hypothetical protein